MFKKLLVLGASLLFVSSAIAQTREVSLGRVRVTNLQTDLEARDFRDICNVVGIRALVLDEKADINWIGVEFVNERARPERLNVNRTLRANEDTGVLDLRGSNRCIDRVVVNASSRGSFWRSSTIELFAVIAGRMSPGPGPRPGPRPPIPAPRLTQPDNYRVFLLGASSLYGRSGEFITPNHGSECMSQVKLQALNDNLSINRVSVMLDDGSTHDLFVPRFLSRDTETAWISVPQRRGPRGSISCIRRFLIDGRSDNTHRGPEGVLRILSTR
jgi:hypothetical protein